MDRRRFLLCAAPLAAAAAGAAPPVRPGGKPVIPAVDTHQHLIDFSKVRLGWLKPGDDLAKACGVADYAAAAAGLGITKAVYMEVDVVPEDKQKEADWVTELCASGDTVTVAAVVGGRPDGPEFADYCKQFKGSKYVKGVRQVLQGPDWPSGACLKPAFVKGVQRLGELGLTFDLCGPPTELDNFAELVGLCPETRFVLDHGGNPRIDFSADEAAAWRAGLSKVAGHKNAVCKLSGFLANGDAGKTAKAPAVRPFADAILSAFGADRVMFGGDWPVVTKATPLANWLEMVRTVLSGRPEAEQRAVLGGTAAAFYGL